ncbi:MAG TPA: phosphoheptose isomerase [Thiobacillaceae bacterium]|nr:phosphoheptose isomerase [Thiobacillaceae bacterium]
MDLIERIQNQFEQSARLKLDSAELLAVPIARAADRILQCVLSDGKVLACGNGGSAADSQHFAAEMVNRFEQERPGLAAIALTTDTSILTSIANDYAYHQVFARQVTALGQPGDVLLAISTSGNSESVVRAAQAAHERDMSVIALSGRDGGNLAEQLSDSDILICVPADNTARIQEIHLLTIHCLCEAVDSVLLGVA